MKRFIIFLSLFIVLQSQLVSLEHSSKFRNWYNTNYITDIMSVDNKFAICSSRGFILFTPQNGEFVILNKSDGIIDNQINGLVSDSENLFLFTPSGITVLSVDTTRIRNISTSFSGIEGEPSIGLLKGDTVFLGTTEYLYIWDTEGDPYNPFNMSWTNNPYTFRNYGINALFFEDDTLYVGTNGGLCMVPDYSFTDTTQWIWNSVGEGLPDSIVTDVASWEGELWIGTEDGIVSGSMNNWILRNNGLYSQEVNRFFSDDTLWAATENSPHYWNGSLSTWVRVYQGIGSIRRIKGITSDNTGTIWVGIDGNGIAYLDDTLWQCVRIPGPSSSNFSDITIDENGDIWGVHYGGFVSEQRGRTISHFQSDGWDGEWEILNDTNELGLIGNIRWVDVDQHNNKWFGIWGIATEVDIVKLSEVGEWDSLGLPVSGVVGSQFIDSKGNKWFSNFSSSVCKLGSDDSTWQVYTDENFLNYIVAFAEDHSGNMYFGSAQRGVNVMTTDGTWIRVTGLPSEEAFDLAFDRNGDLLVGTPAGVAVVRDFVTINSYTRTTSGLLGDNIMDILIDWKGSRWFLVGSRGVSLLRY
ncbi:hypothetical protein KAX75_10905, partial [candidate division WOR-3 bacterium]|nr:hypothetical protein [candidate division WOR-3 bacterium]